MSESSVRGDEHKDPACGHPSPALSLPAQISVAPPWHSLPLSQADLGLVFSNSSPFAFSQSLLMIAPARAPSKAGFRASFGHYSVAQLISSPLLPVAPPLSASLLSKSVEHDVMDRYMVRALFHWRGDASGGQCITLHAFKATEEQRTTCITQPPLGLCVATLNLPKHWFDSDNSASPNQSPVLGSKRHWGRKRHRGRRHGGSRAQRGRTTARVQLYYSCSGFVTNFKMLPLRCTEDKLQQSQKRLFYLGAVAPSAGDHESGGDTESMECPDALGEELRLDSNIVIGYQKGPVREGRRIGVSVSLMSNFTGDLVVIRLKVKKGLLSLKAHTSRTPDAWVVALERNTGSKHDTISIICHKGSSSGDSYSPGTPRQIACLSVEGLRRSFGVAMTVAAHWWVEYSGRNNHVSPRRAAVSTFSFADRDILGIAPVTESSTIINTAMLSSQPVSLSVIVLAVGGDGKVSDVTAAVTCHSDNEDVVKVSSDCSAVFVDGSESGVGGVCVGVEFSLGTFSGALCLSVWAPVVPFLILLSDPVLNAIEGWSYYNEAGCSPVYQRSTVQVLAQFAAQPLAQTSQLTYMLGSPDWFVDVTELVADWLKVADPRVAQLDEQRNLIGLEPGVTSVHVISSQWDGVLGSCDVTVTDNAVLPGDLSVQLIGGLGLSIKANPTHPSIVTATVTARNTLYNLGQEASLSIGIQFSDDTATLLSAFHAVPFSLRLSSLAESVVVVTPAPPQRVVAQGDGGGPLLKAELLVSICQPTSSSVRENGVVMRRLARGSGWVRVNLDSDFQRMEMEEPEWKMQEISKVLLESTRDAYNSFGDESPSGNSSRYYNGHNMSMETELEKAVLTPNHEESGVYFSEKAKPEDRPGLSSERETEMGVGAVLSLFFLSGLLFLANCVPCALWENRSKRRNEKEQAGQEDGEDRGQGVEDYEMRNGKRNKRGAVALWWGGL
ncbi:transmembrane protein 132C [Scleropages formosus]|uniref:transmembrane protein 132C n=1 Tax=Scleropages formosus TaxID=113540 RepID=UPI0010FAA555|nr:transmembrane protein 132C-like [Scleropages formosus]